MTAIAIINFIKEKLFATHETQAALISQIDDARSFDEALQIIFLERDETQLQQVLAPFLRAATIRYMRETPSEWSTDHRKEQIVMLGAETVRQSLNMKSLSSDDKNTYMDLIIAFGSPLYEDYLTKQAQDGVWGEDTEAANLADLLEMTLYITSKKAHEEEHRYNALTSSDDRPIVFLFCTENHWFINPEYPYDTLPDNNCLYNAFAQVLRQQFMNEFQSAYTKDDVVMEQTFSNNIQPQKNPLQDSVLDTLIESHDLRLFPTDKNKQAENIEPCNEPAQSPTPELRELLANEIQNFRQACLTGDAGSAINYIKSIQDQPEILNTVLLESSDALAAVFRLVCREGDIESVKEFVKAAKTEPEALQYMLLAGRPGEQAEAFRLACRHKHIEIAIECIKATQNQPGTLQKMLLENLDVLAEVFLLTCLHGNTANAKEFIKAAKIHPKVLERMLLTGNREHLAEGFRLACLHGHIEIVKTSLQAAQSQRSLIKGLVNNCILYARQSPEILMGLLLAGIPQDKLTVDLQTAYADNDSKKISDCVARAIDESQKICSTLLDANFIYKMNGFFTNPFPIAEEVATHNHMSRGVFV